jgi:integrase
MDYIPPIIKKIQDVNLNKKINIRAKKGGKQKRWSLFLDYFSEGKHKFIFPKKYIIGTPQSKAEDNQTLTWMQEYRDETLRRMNNGEDVFKEREPIASMRFLDFIESAGKGKERLPMYQGLKKHITNFSNDQLSFKDITPAFCRKFKDYLSGLISESTVKTYFSALKATIHLAMKEEIISDDPCKNISIKAPSAKREFLLQDELEAVVNKETEYTEVKNAFLFSCFCGLRLSDIRKLTWKEVEGGYLYFRQRKTKGIDRMLMSADAMSILETQKEKHKDSMYVFDLPASKDKINKKLDAIIKSVEITKKITFHCGRHTAATSWISAGVDIFTVQKLLGHEDIKTTMIYAKLIDKKRDEYVEKMPVLIKQNDSVPPPME